MLEKRIGAAQTLTELQAAGRLFGEIREKGKLAHNEIARVRMLYDTRLDALEQHDPDNPFRRSVASISDAEEDARRKSILLEARTPYELQHGSLSSAPFDEDDVFVRAHVEVLLPSVEVPQLQDGPAHIRDRSLLLTASKVVYTNTPRCAKVGWRFQRRARNGAQRRATARNGAPCSAPLRPSDKLPALFASSLTVASRARFFSILL